MGNQESLPILSQEQTVPVIRYTVEVDIRYRGRVKAYKYCSAEYGIEIFPFDLTNPLTPYDETKWRGMSNKKETVYLKKDFLVTCKKFLEAKEVVVNEIQKTLDVS